MPISIEHRQRMYNLYKNATVAEKQFIDSLLGKFYDEYQVDAFFSGAHIELRGDDGKHHTLWTELFTSSQDSPERPPTPALKTRNKSSSHLSIDAQLSFKGEVVSEALFGTRLDARGEKFTWVQLERHAVASLEELMQSRAHFIQGIGDTVRHGFSYVEHLRSGMNIGPYGVSEYTEKSAPLIIDVCLIDSDEEQLRAMRWRSKFLETPPIDEEIGESMPTLTWSFSTVNSVASDLSSFGLERSAIDSESKLRLS